MVLRNYAGVAETVDAGGLKPPSSECQFKSGRPHQLNGMSNMKRRTFIGAAAAALAIPLLPAIAANPRITWLTGAKENRHALLVAENLSAIMREGILYAQSDLGGIGNYAITLTDPHFVVRTGRPIWNVMDGYRGEEGLGIKISDAGLFIGEVGLCSTAGTSWKELPPYYMRAPRLAYDETHELRAALGDRLGYDMRWFEQLKRREAA